MHRVMTRVNPLVAIRARRLQSVVQQSDIDTAANDLATANAPAAASILQFQLVHNEHLVGDPQCQPQVSADHKVGEVAKFGDGHSRV